MRTRQRAALRATARRRPALRGRTPMRRATATRAVAALASRASWSPTSGTPSASSVAADRALRPAAARSARPSPARSTFGDHSAAVPFSAITCAKPNAAALRRMLPTLPASCRRSSTTRAVAGAQRRGAGAVASTKPIGAGDSSVLTLANSASGTTRDSFGAACASSRSAGVVPAGVADHRLRTGRPPRAATPGTGARLRARRSPSLR